MLFDARLEVVHEGAYTRRGEILIADQWAFAYVMVILSYTSVELALGQNLVVMVRSYCNNVILGMNGYYSTVISWNRKGNVFKNRPSRFSIRDWNMKDSYNFMVRFNVGNFKLKVVRKVMRKGKKSVLR